MTVKERRGEVRELLEEKRGQLRQFGKKLRLLREARGMTQMQLADALCIDYRQISRYETGSAEMGAMLYERALDVLGARPNDEQTRDAIQQFSTLSPEHKKQVIEFMGFLKMNQK